MNKKGASFGTIVAVMGSILISVGVAWLIAQNWHQIPAPIKILILFIATSVAFFAGTLLRIRNYPGIGKALLILGSLLYTLSIFLIAQIFFTSSSPQGIAWLLLIAWIGVFIFSYIFESSGSLVVGLVEFLIWIIIQYMAFSEAAREMVSPGILAFYFLFTGILIYGISLIHKSKIQKFASVYQFWTVFYFLAFTYVLSFQTVLPIMWPQEGSISTPSAIFLFCLGLVSTASAAAGIFIALKTKSTERRDVLMMISVIVVLAALIGLTALTSNSVGQCNRKECYEFRTQPECAASSQKLNCKWADNVCQTDNCYLYKTEVECGSKYKSMGCHWTGKECLQKECFEFKTDSECSGSISVKCKWDGQNCIYKDCWSFQTEAECSSADGFECKWKNSNCVEYQKCNEYASYDSCKQNPECQWRSGVYGGIFEDSGISGDRGQSKIPLVLWVVWITINVAFILLIIYFVGYGTWKKLPKIINLGIVFFALDIVTRYIGFIIDLWSYTSLAIVFITGGIVLLAGGWLIEKWRRKLINQTREKSTRGL